MKIYPNLVQGLALLIQQVLGEQQLADDALEQLFKQQPQWGARDRRWVAEHFYCLVRYHRLALGLLGRTPEIPEDWQQLVGIAHWLLYKEIPATTIWQELNAEQLEQEHQRLTQQRAIRESIPDWLDERASQELGAEWETILTALNQPTQVIIRTNTIKATNEQVIAALAQQNIPATLLNNQALLLNGRPNLHNLEVFKKGWLEVQDGASQQIAPLLTPQMNDVVVDACAGAGGKTLQIAALMRNKGKLMALDIEQKKLDELQKRAKRAGATIVQTQCISGLEDIQKLYGTANKLLLDVPCSGLGTLRRSPDLKFRLTNEFIETVRATQRYILEHYTPICQSGGCCVYATCSVLPSENAQQIEWFLTTPIGQEFELISQHHFLPNKEGFDGFYAAVLRRK